MRLSRILIGLLGIVILGAGAFAVYAWRPAIAPVDPQPSFAPDVIARGAGLALIGNCNTCHTAVGGAPYAGGAPVATPFGTIYATNITPDPETGIGRWSEAAFRRAMHEGVARDGQHLYPAFPYDHFTKVSDEDVGAIYAFLMTREPVNAPARAHDLSFPFNLRPLIAGWKLLFFREGRYQADAAQSADANRGAYLVDGLAHCGACHTPRNGLGAEKRDQAFSGGDAEGWHAPALNSDSTTPVAWTDGQLATYLRQGFVFPHGVAAGPMQAVINNLADAPAEDVKAIANYVDSILEPATAGRRQQSEELLARLKREAQAGASASAASRTVGVAPGAALSEESILYAGACANCHEPTGQRFSAHGIPLSLSKVVALPDPSNLIHLILEGVEPPAGAPFAFMPGFAGILTDEQIVQLVDFMRRTYSDQPPWRDVEAQLRKVRQAGKS